MSKAKKTAKRKVSPRSREALRKVWREHSRKRHAQYATNAEYREQVRTRTRELTQARRGTQLTDCRVNLSELNDIGSRRTVLINGEPSVRLCFTLAEAAEALMLSTSRMRVWVRDKIVPAPVVRASLEGEKTLTVRSVTAPVYLKSELEVMILLTGEHRSRIAYIRRGPHDGLIKQVAQHVQHERRRIGLA